MSDLQVSGICVNSVVYISYCLVVHSTRHCLLLYLCYIRSSFGILMHIFASGILFFFFSSRRRHTRWTGDWSSDVCSSDLGAIVYEMMRTGELEIDPSCGELLKTLPLVSRDKDKPEHTVKFDGDDPFDALKHLIHYRIGAGQRPYDEVVREQGKKIEDPFARWVYITKQLQSRPKDVITPNYNRPAWMGVK